MLKKHILAITAISFLVSSANAQKVLDLNFESNTAGEKSGIVLDNSQFENNGYLHTVTESGALIVEPGANGSTKAVELHGGNDDDIFDYDSVIVPDSPSLSITGDLTISAWIKRTADNENKSAIVTKTYGSDTHKVEYWFGVVNNHLQYYDNASNTILADTQSMELNKWYYVAMVRNIKDKTIKFYINGKLIYTANDINTDIQDTDYGVSIGSCIPCYAPFTGEIDNIHIDNSALNSDEIMADMNFDTSGSSDNSGDSNSNNNWDNNSSCLNNGYKYHFRHHKYHRYYRHHKYHGYHGQKGHYRCNDSNTNCNNGDCNGSSCVNWHNSRNNGNFCNSCIGNNGNDGSNTNYYNRDCNRNSCANRHNHKNRGNYSNVNDRNSKSGRCKENISSCNNLKRVGKNYLHIRYNLKKYNKKAIEKTFLKRGHNNSCDCFCNWLNFNTI